MNPDSSLSNPLDGVATIATRWVAFPLTRAQLAALSLTVMVAAALTFRTSGLASHGLSDDEVTKLRAAQAYSRGDFSVNAEHPMLLKLAVWGSVSVADRWNRIAPERYQVAVEEALRLPNAIAGAATVLALYGVAHACFGTAVALIAAMLLALDPNATAINRIGKEDTFVVLFFMLAVWCYERATQAGIGDRRLAQSWYTASAASFGLMMASKYLPHLYGLYLLANLVTVRADGGSRPIRRRFFVAMGVAFVAANFALLLPATWWNIVAYVQGETLTHHGHPYAGRLWVTDVPISALGVPPTFYLMFVLSRMPLVVLAGCAAGAVITLARRREHGYGFLRVMLLFLAAGSSVMAAKFLRYSLPMLVLLDLMAAVGIVAALNWLLAGRRHEVRSVALSVACAALAVTLLTGQAQASPHFAMHRNLLARWLDADGRRFPEAGYDYGVREAVSMIAATAGPGAVIVNDVPSIVRFYLEGRGRTDIGIRSFSAHGLSRDATEQWVFVQDAHVYFETAELIAQLRRRHEPVEIYALRGVPLLEVFRVPEP